MNGTNETGSNMDSPNNKSKERAPRKGMNNSNTNGVNKSNTNGGQSLRERWIPTFPPPCKCESHHLAGFASYHWFDPTTNQILSTLVSTSGPVELQDVNAPLIKAEEEEQEAAEDKVALERAFTVLVPSPLINSIP
jgi:hypothetical protein